MRILFLSLVFCGNVIWANTGSDCQGYQVLSDKNAISLKIGIKTGDIIKSFDGVGITSSKLSMELYSKLDLVGKHEIVIERNGKVEKIKYEIAQAYKVIQ